MAKLRDDVLMTPSRTLKGRSPDFPGVRPVSCIIIHACWISFQKRFFAEPTRIRSGLDDQTRVQVSNRGESFSTMRADFGQPNSSPSSTDLFDRSPSGTWKNWRAPAE